MKIRVDYEERVFYYEEIDIPEDYYEEARDCAMEAFLDFSEKHGMEGLTFEEYWQENMFDYLEIYDLLSFGTKNIIETSDFYMDAEILDEGSLPDVVEEIETYRSVRGYLPPQIILSRDYFDNLPLLNKTTSLIFYDGEYIPIVIQEDL